MAKTTKKSVKSPAKAESIKIKTGSRKIKSGKINSEPKASSASVVSTPPAKDTIYIEADEEITVIIDKVVSSKKNIIAVVLPKRATVFQSAVNMKLLQRSAKSAKKNLVLITQDQPIMNIAAISKVLVASTVNSKPSVPDLPAAVSSEATISTSELESGEITEPAEEIITAGAESKEEEPIEIDNTSNDEDENSEDADKKPKKSKKLAFKIPDFGSFRLKMGASIVAVILIAVGWFVGFIILPKATITIQTDTSRVNTSVDISVSLSADASDIENLVLKAKRVEVSKEDKVTAKATGKKDVGEKASGFVTITNCFKDDEGVTLPAGSTLSAGGLNYVTTESLVLGPAVYAGSNCISDSFPAFGAVADVNVTAAGSGEQYNQAARGYASGATGISGYGSAMTGGTTKEITVVSSEDIEGATNQLKGSSTADALEELRADLSKDNLTALEETIEESDAKTIRSASVDQEIEEFTVTRTVVYSMVGVSETDLNSVLDNAIKDKLTDATQNIRSNGFDSIITRLTSKPSDTEFNLTIKTVATIGPEFNIDQIKSDVAGLNRGEVENLLEARKGVQSIEIEFSPFFIFQIPNDADKITVIINEPEN